MKNHFRYPILIFLVFISCNDRENKIENKEPLYYENKNIKYGFDFNKFFVNQKKIKRGDTFGSILESNGIDYPEVHNILQKEMEILNFHIYWNSQIQLTDLL